MTKSSRKKINKLDKETLCIVFYKKDSRLDAAYFPTTWIRAGVLIKYFLIDVVEEKIIVATDLWKILYDV